MRTRAQMKTPQKYLVRSVYRQIAIVGAPLMLSPKGRTRFREFFDRRIIELFREEIEHFVQEYPKVWTEEDTLRHIIKNNSSICRFGDGELKLMVGERHKSFQDVDPELNSRLMEVLRSNEPNILVGIHPVREFDSLGRVWQKFIIRIGQEVLALLDQERSYPSMGAFRVLPEDSKASFIKRVQLIKEIWQDRKVLLVVGENSRFTFEKELFNNAASVGFLYAPAKNAFKEYQDILKQIHDAASPEHLIMPVLGPTATVLAYDLAREGFQAIDFGQMPGTFRQAKRKLFGDENHPIPELA